MAALSAISDRVAKTGKEEEKACVQHSDDLLLRLCLQQRRRQLCFPAQRKPGWRGGGWGWGWGGFGVGLGTGLLLAAATRPYYAGYYGYPYYGYSYPYTYGYAPYAYSYPYGYGYRRAYYSPRYRYVGYPYRRAYRYASYYPYRW
jgi:hypothetical protein